MDNIDIISYKHDGELHRVWRDVIKVHEDQDKIILINNEVEVIDGDGWRWKTREPAVCYFFKEYWFNIICMIRKDKIFYYCNLSSPYVIDYEGLKYIDYDLDVKVFPDGEVLILDRDEYDFNIKNLRYSNKITTIIERNLDILIKMINNREDPFNDNAVKNWYNYYKKMAKEEEKIDKQ